MKKGFLKRIAAATLAAGLVFAGTVGAMAETMPFEGKVTTEDTTIVLKRAIKLYNTNSADTEIHLPQVTYNYSLTNFEVTEGKTVTDADNNSVKVHSGVTGGLTLNTSSITFNKTTANDANSSGVEVKQDITLTADPSVFTTPGVYRYKLTETVDGGTDALTAVGISRESGETGVRYIDVYIFNDGGTGKKVGGYVCFAASSGDIDITKDTTGKSDGYVDEYHTYNVRISKFIEGALADKTHAFPFSINTSGVTGQTFTRVTETGSAAGTIGTAFTESLGHEKYVDLIGLPANTKITSIDETNDTFDVYKTKITYNDSDSNVTLAEASIAAGAHAAFSGEDAVTNYATYTTSITQSKTSYKVTNTLAQVSPTGLAFRYAPYALLLGAVGVLMVVMHRIKAR